MLLESSSSIWYKHTMTRYLGKTGKQSWLMFLCLLVIIDLLLPISCSSRVYYDYKRYSYRKKQKNERRIKRFRQQCEDGGKCLHMVGLEQMNCVRGCMSSDCYQELYHSDPLEEGEIDVRYNSFKGCVLQNRPPNE